MTEPGPPTSPSPLDVLKTTPAEQLRLDAAVRLSHVAQYLTGLIDRVRDTSQPPAIEALRTGEAALHDVIGVLAIAVEDGTAPAREAFNALPPLPFLDKDRLAAEVYPDSPFYRGIVGSEFIPPMAEPPADQAINLHIISPFHLEINGTVIELSGEILYMFNALLVHRDKPTSMPEFLQYGFRESRTHGTTIVRANNAMRELRKLLQGVLPKDTDAIVMAGKNRWITRQLSTRFLIKDVRGNPAFAHLVPISPDKILSGKVGTDPVARTSDVKSSKPPAQAVATTAPKPKLTLYKASDIVARIQAEHPGLNVSERQIKNIAAGDTMIMPVYEGGEDLFSDYAVRRIIKALLSNED